MGDQPPRLNRHTYVRLTVISLWENLPLVLLATFVFSLLCAPAFLLFILDLFSSALVVGVLTIPPAWAALLALEAGIVREVKTDIWTMFRALPRFWSRGVRLGLLVCFPLVVALLTLPALSRPQVSLVAWLGFAADVTVLLVLVTLYLYVFPLLVLYDIGAGTALRNALILASRNIGNTLGLLAMGVLFYFATAYLSSGLIFFLPAILGVFIVNNTRMVVEEELGGEQGGP